VIAGLSLGLRRMLITAMTPFGRCNGVGFQWPTVEFYNESQRTGVRHW
jgi:hypothetical protein